MNAGRRGSAHAGAEVARVVDAVKNQKELGRRPAIELVLELGFRREPQFVAERDRALVGGPAEAVKPLPGRKFMAHVVLGSQVQQGFDARIAAIALQQQQPHPLRGFAQQRFDGVNPANLAHRRLPRLPPWRRGAACPRRRKPTPASSRSRRPSSGCAPARRTSMASPSA